MAAVNPPKPGRIKISSQSTIGLYLVGSDCSHSPAPTITTLMPVVGVDVDDGDAADPFNIAMIWNGMVWLHKRGEEARKEGILKSMISFLFLF
jgi:hypothetical protein